MNIFSKRWFTYNKIILSKKYADVAKERINGVDFRGSNFFKDVN